MLGWFEYFRVRPPGWREDNRAAVIALSFGGGKDVKPEDLFASLQVIKDSNKPEEDKEPNNGKVGADFFKRFKHRFTEENPFGDEI